MQARSNALSELTRFWLEQRHGYLVRESVPVPVPYALSDIDLFALRIGEVAIALPNGGTIGPRLIVETKDEHDWEPLGREFAKFALNDAELMGDKRVVPAGTKGVKFSMLREEHFNIARQLFETEDFDRLFVVHALDPQRRSEIDRRMAPHRVYWLTVAELLKDLSSWYAAHPRPAGLRNSLIGDLLHLLLGFGKLRLEPSRFNER
jgi:hypothetical protein